MTTAQRVVALVLCFAVFTWAQGNSFDKIRYNGGSVNSSVDPKDWHNRLTVSSDSINLVFKDGKTISIPPKNVTSLSYGEEAHRRVGTMIALAILISPIALFGLLHKTRLHFIGIQYRDVDGKPAGILLQGDKDNYRAILVALQGVTRVPVTVGEKDREFLPVGVTVDVTKAGQEAAASAGAVSSPKGAINVSSDPTGAEVSVDGEFVGNTPSNLKLDAGKHTITIKMSGFADWSREITVEAGSEVHVAATLAK
jgi:PEGA domain